MQSSTPGLEFPEISDEMMKQALANTRAYTIVILKRGPSTRRHTPTRSSGNTAGAILRCAQPASCPSCARSVMVAKSQASAFLMPSRTKSNGLWLGIPQLLRAC